MAEHFSTADGSERFRIIDHRDYAAAADQALAEGRIEAARQLVQLVFFLADLGAADSAAALIS